jgi:hypothetical protein
MDPADNAIEIRYRLNEQDVLRYHWRARWRRRLVALAVLLVLCLVLPFLLAASAAPWTKALMGLGVFLAFVVLMVLAIRRQARMTARKAASRGDVQARLSAQGIDLTMSVGSSTLLWAGVRGIKRTPDAIWVEAGHAVHVFPKRAFDPRPLDEVEARLRAWHASPSVAPKPS